MALDKAEGEKYRGELTPEGKALFVDDKLLSAIPDERAANIALLGRLSTMLDLPDDVWEKAIAMEMPEKFVAMNTEAFRAGRTGAGR